MITTRASGDRRKVRFRFLLSDDERCGLEHRCVGAVSLVRELGIAACASKLPHTSSRLELVYGSAEGGLAQVCGGVVPDSQGKSIAGRRSC